MATPEEKVGADDEVLVDGEMLGSDPVLASVNPDDTTSKELKGEAAKEEEGKKEEKESGDGKGLDQLKTTLLISGAVVALIGAIFAVVKQIKQA